MSDLQAKLAAIKELAANSKPTAHISDSKQATPLEVIVDIYNKASKECYINHMEGAKLLIQWFTMGEQEPIDLQLTAYREATFNTFRIPSLLYTYELTELTKLILASMSITTRNMEVYVEHFSIVSKAIYLSIADISTGFTYD